MIAFLLLVCFERVELVDRIELHGLLKASGEGYEYEQVIFWDWNSEYRRFEVVGWRLLGPTTLSEYPVRVGRTWQCSWYNHDKREEVRVIAKLFMHTVATVDPERQNKRVLDEKYRRILFKDTCFPR